MAASGNPVMVKTEYCSKCLVCVSSCPYEAITPMKEADGVKIDVGKCQVCGICYSGCPAGAIEAVYYNLDSLIRHLQASMKTKHQRTVVLSCRGSALDPKAVKGGVVVPNSIPLFVPCVGRVPADFFLGALSIGVQRVVVVACRDKFCHYKSGSRINKLKLRMLGSLVQQLGYETDTFTLETLRPVAHVDEAKCTGCLTCGRICAYDAPSFDKGNGSKAEIDIERCSGCGVCVGECPAHAIEVGYG